jgi:hypothetical protein
MKDLKIVNSSHRWPPNLIRLYYLKNFNQFCANCQSKKKKKKDIKYL